MGVEWRSEAEAQSGDWAGTRRRRVLIEEWAGSLARGRPIAYWRILKLTLLVSVPPGVVTTTLPVVAPLGTTAAPPRRPLLQNLELHVADEIPGWCCDRDRPTRCATWDVRCHVGIADHGETCRSHAAEHDGCRAS
jgi:hypothetical protein